MCVFQHIHWVGFWHVSCFVSMFSGVYKCVDVMCIYIYIRISIWLIYYGCSKYVWAPVKILYIWVVATVMVIAFGGGLSLSRVSWKTAYSWSNMKPKSIPEQARKWIEQLFCWFQALRQHFMFLSCCIHLHACSFMFLAFAFVFLSLCIHSFHVPFMFLLLVFMSIHFPFFSFQCAFMSSHVPFICTHVPFILHSCPFISFLKWKWLYGLARELSATKGYR